MSDFKTRLIIEKNDLTEKIVKLSAFLTSEGAKKIDDMQMELLEIQLHAMITYQNILTMRIKWLEIT